MHRRTFGLERQKLKWATVWRKTPIGNTNGLTAYHELNSVLDHVAVDAHTVAELPENGNQVLDHGAGDKLGE